MTQSRQAADTIEVFGIPLSARSLATAADEVLFAVGSGERGHVCIANVDMFTRAIRMPRLLSAMKGARLVVADGMPLIWLQRCLGLRSAKRVYGPDFMAELCRRSEAGNVPIFLFGGSGEILEKLSSRLLQNYPALRIAGRIAPPMLPQDPPLDPASLQALRLSGARLVFVGLGCPKQELWMQTHGRDLDAVMVGVGLAFAQIAGMLPRAPAWMQRSGLEWAFRLAQEPGRLWKRYLVGNTIFAGLAIAALLGAYISHLRGRPRQGRDIK